MAKYYKRKYSDDQLRIAITTSRSIREVLLKLGLCGTGGGYTSIKRYIEHLQIDTTHLKGQSWRTNLKIPPKRPIEYYLQENSCVNSSSLRKRLIYEEIFEFRCNKCKLNSWNDLPISLELEHKDGNHFNNLLENLELLCPNCHAQTPTYRGKNHAYRSNITCSKTYDPTKTVSTKSTKKIKRPRNKKKHNTCLDCARPISNYAVRCKSCAGKEIQPTKIPWMPIEELLERLKTSNYSALARELGVSDNAIRKHISKHTTLSVNALST